MKYVEWPKSYLKWSSEQSCDLKKCALFLMSHLKAPQKGKKITEILQLLVFVLFDIAKVVFTISTCCHWNMMEHENCLGKYTLNWYYM